MKSQAKYEHLLNNLHLIEVDTENGIIHTKNQILENGRGYLHTYVKSKMFYVHQVVMIAAGINPVGAEINHKDGNKHNNRLDNLELVTRGENNKHAWDNGLKRKKYGADNPMHNPVYTDEIIDKMQQDFESGMSVSSIVKKYHHLGVRYSKTYMILKNKRYGRNYW